MFIQLTNAKDEIVLVAVDDIGTVERDAEGSVIWYKRRAGSIKVEQSVESIIRDLNQFSSTRVI